MPDKGFLKQTDATRIGNAVVQMENQTTPKKSGQPVSINHTIVYGKITNIGNASTGRYSASQVLVNDGLTTWEVLENGRIWDTTEDNLEELFELNFGDSLEVGDIVAIFGTNIAGLGGIPKWVIVGAGAAPGGGDVGSGGGDGNCEIIYAVSKATFDANSAGTNVTFGDLTCYNVVLCPDPCFDFPACSNGGPSMAVSLFDADYAGGNIQWIDLLFTPADIVAGTKKCLCADNWNDTSIQNGWARSSATNTGQLNIGRLFISNPGSGRVRIEIAGSGTVSSFAHNVSPVCGNFVGSPVCADGYPTSAGQLPIPDAYFFSYTQGGIVYAWERGSDWGC